MKREVGSDHEGIRSVKLAIYQLGLPAGAVMALLLFYFENAQGTLHIVDKVGLPLLSALLMGLWPCFKLRLGDFMGLELLLFGGVSLMVLSSLSYSAFRVSGGDWVNLTGLGYWTPVLYAMAFLMFGLKTGRNISLTLYALILGVWASQLLFDQSSNLLERSILFQLFASNALLLLLLYGFGLQAQQAAHYAQDAHTDPLTQLPNRRALSERLTRELGRSSRYARPFSVVLIDLDHFKDINDNRGHHVGDLVLIEVALLLGTHIRTPDTAGRWGGEEFLLLFPELALADATEATERFRRALEAHPFPHSEQLTASFGVAEALPGDAPETLLARADTALYEAKARGRNCVMPARVESSEGVLAAMAIP